MERQRVCSLYDVPAGSVVRVKALTARGSVRSRLYALGFTPGITVEVCPEACGEGGRRVRVRECSLVLDQGLAEHIECVADIPGATVCDRVCSSLPE